MRGAGFRLHFSPAWLNFGSLGHIERMSDSQTAAIARQTVRISPWVLCGAVLVGLITRFYGFAPIPYLLACVGLAVAWFGLVALAWRRRSDWLRLVALLLIIFGQQLAWHRFGSAHSFEILQGGSVAIAVFSAMLMLLRHWMYKFSRLHNHAA